MRITAKFGMCIFLFLLVVSLVSAAQVPVAQTAGSLQIEYPKSPYLEAGMGNIDLYFHVFNSSGYVVTAPNTNCTVHIYNSTDHHIMQELAVMDGNGLDYEIEMGSNITNNPGTYAYIIQCSNPTEAGFVSDTFVISMGDIEPNNYLVLMLSIAIVIGVLLTIGFKLDADHSPIKLFLIWLSIGLLTLLTTFAQLYALAINAPDSIYGLVNTMMIVSIVLTTIMSFYFMIYFLTMMFNFISKVAQEKKWWNKKDGEQTNR